jgi:hypothetical protein
MISMSQMNNMNMSGGGFGSNELQPASSNVSSSAVSSIADRKMLLLESRMIMGGARNTNTSPVASRDGFNFAAATTPGSVGAMESSASAMFGVNRSPPPADHDSGSKYIVEPVLGAGSVSMEIACDPPAIVPGAVSFDVKDQSMSNLSTTRDGKDKLGTHHANGSSGSSSKRAGVSAFDALQQARSPKMARVEDLENHGTNGKVAFIGIWIYLFIPYIVCFLC